MDKLIGVRPKQRCWSPYERSSLLEGWCASQSYGLDTDDAFRICASVVDGLLKGATPTTTPFEQPIRIALVVNLKSARALGLKFRVQSSRVRTK